MPTKLIDSQSKQFRFNYESDLSTDDIEFINPVLIDTRSNIFNFTCDNKNKPHYTFNIKVNELEYNSKLYYEISYDIEFIPSKNYSPEQNNRYKISAHPFASFGYSDVKFQSFIVYKNSLTQILTDFLLINYIDLEKISGFTTGETYKFNIMKILTLFKINNFIVTIDEENICPYYNLDITQKELEYESGSFYYDIEYNFKFISSDSFTSEENIKHRNLAHPFAPFNNQDDDTKFEGVIVYKNELTKKLVEFLLMDYKELEQKIEHTSVQRYKSNIMESLALLWD